MLRIVENYFGSLTPGNHNLSKNPESNKTRALEQRPDIPEQGKCLDCIYFHRLRSIDRSTLILFQISPLDSEMEHGENTKKAEQELSKGGGGSGTSNF